METKEFIQNYREAFGSKAPLPLQIFAWHKINLTTLAIDACAIPFVLVGAFLGIRLVKFLPEREFRIFTTVVTIISVLVMLLT